nr:ecto-ADP-ribosyltransferase 5-like isoform X1 [Pelodiscus sinensis]|eukprot:XP_014424873.1 ecto-ADP-ribosyltransferase 5-like isoform X1 [Pelodiscus sinensis]
MRSLLILLTYVCLQTWLGTAQVVLDVAANAFDDQYIGCANEMDKEAPALLEEEKSRHILLRKVWHKSRTKWASVKTKLSLPTAFKDEYGRAIVAYTDKYFYSDFNGAVKRAGTSQEDYMKCFQFKAFHYYLTRALQLLRGRCEVTYNTTVYRGTKSQHTGSGLIRFGYFASSSMKRKKAEEFGTGTLFTIRTCFGVKIAAFSHFPEQEEVLIPVHEKFRVTPDGSNRFVLWSTNRTCSHFNCAYLGGKKNQQCLDNSECTSPSWDQTVKRSALFQSYNV